MASYVMLSLSWSDVIFANMYLFLCLHFDIISDRLFSKLLSSFYNIAKFSLRQPIYTVRPR